MFLYLLDGVSLICTIIVYSMFISTFLLDRTLVDDNDSHPASRYIRMKMVAGINIFLMLCVFIEDWMRMRASCRDEAVAELKREYFGCAFRAGLLAWGGAGKNLLMLRILLVEFGVFRRRASSICNSSVKGR